VRCVEISLDDWQFSLRITVLRAAYTQLIPELADLLLAATGTEQATAMLTVPRQKFQLLLSVAGSIGVITSIVAGSDLGVLTYGVGAPLAAALSAGTITALLATGGTIRFHRARWKGSATPACARAISLTCARPCASTPNTAPPNPRTRRPRLEMARTRNSPGASRAASSCQQVGRNPSPVAVAPRAALLGLTWPARVPAGARANVPEMYLGRRRVTLALPGSG
jgi:hypothetical protein